MKYIILIFSEEGCWASEEHEQAVAESVELCHELAREGAYIHAAPLQSSEIATQVRVRDGESLVVDGPFMETKEQLGGYFLIDVPDLDAAIEVARRIPGARRGTAEIRPIVDLKELPRLGSTR